MKFNRKDLEKEQKTMHEKESATKMSGGSTRIGALKSSVKSNDFRQNDQPYNTFAKLPIEISSTFEKMIEQLEIIKNTMEVFNHRISTVESQVANLYNVHLSEKAQESGRNWEPVKGNQDSQRNRYEENQVEEERSRKHQFVSNVFTSNHVENEEEYYEEEEPIEEF